MSDHCSAIARCSGAGAGRPRIAAHAACIVLGALFATPVPARSDWSGGWMQDATRSADLRFGALRNDGYAERADGYGVARSVSSGRVRIHGGSIGQIKLAQPAERLAFAPRNAADESFDGTPNASIYTARRSATAAAQEPEAYAMFLAGLGLIGLMVRRRWTRIDR